MPSWKKILQSGSAVHILNITASGLPNLSQPNVIGYDTASGIFTYFSTSSLVSGGSVIGGSGTQNYITRWSGNTTITTSSIYESDGKIGIGTTDPRQKLHVSGGHVRISNNGEAYLEIITTGSNNSAYIDLVNTGSYLDYGLRLIRQPDGGSYLYHRGTADFGLHANESANIVFYTTASERMRITDSGSVGIGTASPVNTLQVAGGITVVNITASNLPQVSQTYVVGYNPTTGQLTYFPSSSVTPACVTPSPIITVNRETYFYNPSPSGSHFTPQFNSGWYGCSGSVYLEATNQNNNNFTPTYQWYNSSSLPPSPISNATGSRYYPSASGQYIVKINDNTCEAYSTHVNVEFLPPDTFSTGSVSANQTVYARTPITPITWSITTNPVADANPNTSNNGYTPIVIDTGLPPGLSLRTITPFSSGSAVVVIEGTPSLISSYPTDYAYTLILDQPGCQQSNQYPFSYGQGVITVNAPTNVPTIFISGSVKYNNTAQTPMTNTTVQLLSGSNSVIITTAPTDASGSFIIDMAGLPTGTYTITATTNKLWGGVNAVDALAVQRSFIGTAPLAGLRLAAADVNGIGAVNAQDALLINRRFTGAITSFTVGNWRFERLPIFWAGASLTQNLLAIAYGDVNGSYVPNTAL